MIADSSLGKYFLFYIITIIIAVFYGQNPVVAQASEVQSSQQTGLPFFQNFSPADYGGHPQNFCITQDKQGILYFANGNGVLQYDGARWQLIPLPNVSFVYSVEYVEKTDFVYVGGENDLGYLEPNEQGQLQFVSLIEKIPQEHRDFNFVWYTAHNGPNLFFVTDKSLLRWDLEQPEETMTAWPLANIYHTFHILRGEAYVWQWGIGLQRVEGDALRLVPGGEAFAESTIRIMAPWAGSARQEFFIGTVQKGFARYDGIKAEKIYRPPPLQDYINNQSLFNSLQLQDSTFAFATFKGGISFADQQFNIIQILNTALGLQDNVVQFLFVDREQQIWAALDNGIARIEWPSPFSLYSEELGLNGVIQGVLFYGGDLFSYGSSGFFQMTRPSEGDYRTTFVEKNRMLSSNQMLDVIELEGRLVMSASSGISFFDEEVDYIKEKEILAYISANFLKPSSMNKDLIYAGMGKNIGLLQKGVQGWVFTGQVEGITENIQSIEEMVPGQIWVTTPLHAYQVQIPELASNQGLDSISKNSERKIPAQIVKYDQSKGFPTGASSVHSINGQVLFATSKGFKSFNIDLGLFESNFSLPYTDTINQILALNVQINGDIWFISSGKGKAWIHRLIPTGNREYELRSQDFQHKLSEGAIINEIVADPSDSDIAWIATSNGLIKYNSEVKKDYTQGFPALVRKVYINGDSLIFGGAKTKGPLSPLPYTFNSMRFEYAATSYNQAKENKYQVWLEGFDKGWSEWTAEIRKDYTNLPGGDYVFRVRARNVYGTISEDGTFPFSILPPWYRSWWAYLAYVLLLIAGIYGLLRWRVRQLKHRTQELETLVKDRTRMIESQKDRLEQQAEKLKELDQAKSRFFTNISHEFRTPLTIINGMVEQIEKSPQKFLIKGLIMIKRNSASLLNLVNQILDLRRLEAGILKLDLVQVDIISQLKYVFKSFHSLAESKKIKLHFISEYPSLIMDIDKEKMLRIFSNLISNGIKFTSEGGNIYLLITKSASSVLEITVRDTGIGIPKEKLPQIFDRFYQADDSTTRVGEGTGIGLALCKELVKVLNGEISVESEEGAGTTFKIILPITRNAELEKAEIGSQGADSSGRITDGSLLQSATGDLQSSNLPTLPLASEGEAIPPLLPEQGGRHPDNALHSSGQPTLLIIEDNPDLVTYLESLLDNNFQLLIARDGEEGIEMALEHIPDLILSDLMMPKKDGFEVCSMLKNDIRTSHIPIVLLTAKATMEARLEGLERGADAYLLKPFNEKELFIRLEKLTELRQQLQQRYQNTPADSKEASSAAEYLFAIEDAFMKKLKMVVEENLDDSNFGPTQLCKAMGMSRSHLHLKIKALTGQATTHFIRTIRLHKAKELLQKGVLNVSQVVYEVGFNNLSYFSKKFREEFGVNPKDMLEK